MTNLAKDLISFTAVLIIGFAYFRFSAMLDGWARELSILILAIVVVIGHSVSRAVMRSEPIMPRLIKDSVYLVVMLVICFGIKQIA